MVKDTATYAARMYSQISMASGFMKLNNRVGIRSGTYRRQGEGWKQERVVGVGGEEGDEEKKVWRSCGHEGLDVQP